ncbi:MAG: hypothetical protein J6N52_05420, partial [Clostridia bacterium]|nr:hypothetical protein [Clostridia bacterium]
MKKLTGLLMAFIMTLALFPSAYAADTAYTIDDVYFTNLSGGILENPTTSCLVNVELTKTAERLGEDIVVIASYSTDGAMIGFTTVAGTMEKGKTSSFSSLVVSSQDKSIGVVKAYVWNNISEMRTLSEVYMEFVNEMDEGVELPPVTQDPAEENYIPKVITARGIVAGTPLSDDLANGEYEISKLRIPYDLNTFDGIYTEDDYFALATRMEQISVIYDIPLATPYDGTYTVLSELDLCDYLKYEMEFELTLIDGDYVILDAQPLSLSGNVLKFDADDYVMQEDLDNSYQYSTSNSKIKFGSKYYRLEDEVEIYVNGVLTEMIYSESDITSELTEAQYKLDAYLGNARGTITLLDDGVNSGYETISVDIWNVGKVSSVEYKNSETVVTIITREAVDVEYEEIVITDEAIENGDTILSVTRNGSETTLTALAKNDIIAYKTDFQNNTSATLRDPKQIEILATNDTVYGMVTAVDTNEKTYSIDGTKYEYVKGLGTLLVGNTYTLSLDPFGRIYSSEIDVLASYKMAIGLGITSTDQLKLLLSDGSTKSYDIISSVVITGFGDVDGDSISNKLSDVEAHLNNTENGPIDRVVEYSLSALQKITKIALTPADEDATLYGNEYTARTGKLGSCEILSTTPVIDATEATAAPKQSSSYSSFNAESFKDGSTYKFAAWKSGT